MNLTLSSLSTDYVQVPVSAAIDGANYNPTPDTVQLAFMAPGASPGTSDWHTGSWDTPSAGTYMAQVLIGPAAGGIVLTPGTYTIWVKVTDNPEVPVRTPGFLVIT